MMGQRAASLSTRQLAMCGRKCLALEPSRQFHLSSAVLRVSAAYLNPFRRVKLQTRALNGAFSYRGAKENGRPSSRSLAARSEVTMGQEAV